MHEEVLENLTDPIGEQIQRQKLIVTGTVQSVGFRPFVYRLAKRFQLTGSVTNVTGEVHIEIQGQIRNIAKFQDHLIINSPPLADPKLSQIDIINTVEDKQFLINNSNATIKNDIHLSPDFFACDDCLAEMLDPNNRRYHYPLISCTQCGPRYSIIRDLPYDRHNTSLEPFQLCAECLAEYNDPNDRRFHAETISCHQCGPQMSYIDSTSRINNNNSEAISKCIEQLKNGKIIAIKGIGGYHLVCDANNFESVALLRKRKHRPDKPLAVMMPVDHDFHLLRKTCEIDKNQYNFLLTPQRPIVLVNQQKMSKLAQNITPGINKIGILFPYSPLHTLISQQFGETLVVTSGNISGEPVIIDNQIAEKKLATIADGFLRHNRPILHPVDDSVFQFIKNKPQAIRLGRGISPLELTLPKPITQPTVALGAFYKNTIALAWNNRLVISPHIGNMDSPSSLRSMEKTIDDLQSLYGVRGNLFIHDAHPDYSNTRWVDKHNKLSKSVYHHFAHASSLAFEHPEVDRWLMFTWDSVGLGLDNTIWGGETMVGSPGKWQRISSLKPFYLPGGEVVSKKPMLSALSLCWETNVNTDHLPTDNTVFKLWLHKVNSPQSTAMARLFDAAAALLGLIDESSYDGHAPMLLEAKTTEDLSLFVDIEFEYSAQRKLWEINWTPLIKLLLNQSLSVSQRATAFHASLARLVVNQIKYFQIDYTFSAVGFTGGVFQNHRLCYFIQQLMDQENILLHFHQKLPSNDASICVGQIMEEIYQEAENSYVK